MKAIAIYPRQPNTAHLAELPMPKVSDAPNGRGGAQGARGIAADRIRRERLAAGYLQR